MEKDTRISLSENDWTDNKLYMEWIRGCLELETKIHF